MKPEENKQKALELESKGDELKAEGRFEEAFNHYKEALSFSPDSPILYQKLAELKPQVTQKWEEEDFSESLVWTMKQQELENPALAELHEKLSGEYQQIKQLVAQMLLSPDEVRPMILNKIKSFGEKAVLPLLHTLLEIDAMAKDQAIPDFDSSIPPPSSFSGDGE